MSDYLVDAQKDAGLSYLADNITERYVCAGTPTDRAGAISAALCTMTGLTSANFTGPVNGDSSGRKITKNAETGDAIDFSGEAATVCYCSASTLIWRVVISPTQTLTSGGTLDSPAHDHEIADPS